jgi:hypothetical protein
MSHLKSQMTEIHLERCVSKTFLHCANIIECPFSDKGSSGATRQYNLMEQPLHMWSVVDQILLCGS